MDLDTAIKHAIDGRAVLFLGSGASVGAKPIEGEKFLTGRELAIRLSNDIKLSPPSDDLNFASQRFRKCVGDSKLVELLQNLFSVSEVADEHRRLSEVPWCGLYTTNYDNVLERAYSDCKKKLVPTTPDQDIKDYITKNSVLHINGYIDRLTSDSLNNSFKLTNTSYLTEAFAKSNWSFIFRRNLETAKAVIFIGYSMYDLDIQRILFGGDALKEKTVFIEYEGKPQEEIESSIQIDFGEVFPIGLKGFWAAYDVVSRDYIAQDNDTAYFAFDEITPDELPSSVRDDDVFEMLFSGDVKTDLVWGTVTGTIKNPYYIARDQLACAYSTIRSGTRNVIAVSDLANGKSMFCLGLACKLAASEAYRIFWLKDDVDNTAEEIERLCSIQGKVLLVVENYSRRLNEVRQIGLKRNENLVLLLTTKTSQHEIYRSDLDEILDIELTIELDLNTIADADLEAVKLLLDTYKLWGDRDAWPLWKKRKFIIDDCGKQFSGVLLDVIKSPEIQRRYSHLFDSFRAKSAVADVVVAASVLKLLDFNNPSETLISEVLNSNYVYSLDFKRNPTVRDVLKFSSGGIVIRSSILAKYGLTTYSDSRELVDRLIKIATHAHDLRNISELYFSIYRELVTFSTLQSMLPDKGKRDSLIRFYEGVKNLEAAKTHPHFWLQYAIARLAFDRPEDLRMAKLFLESAYAHAKKIKGYYTQHLDNVQARYLIQHSKTVPEIVNAMHELCKGHDLLIKQARNNSQQARNNRSATAPYKVARMYLSFYNEKQTQLLPEHKDILKKISEAILEQANKLSNQEKEHETVKQCRNALESLLLKLS